MTQRFLMKYPRIPTVIRRKNESTRISYQLSMNQVKRVSKADATKGEALKQIASIYLGLFCLVALKGILFLQELWNTKLGWDERQICQDSKRRNNIGEDLKKLSYCRFPRYTELCGGYISPCMILRCF